MSFWSNLYERTYNLIDSSISFVVDIANEIISRLQTIEEIEEEDDEFRVLADLDEALDRQEKELYQIEHEIEQVEEEEKEIYDNFPDWLTREEIDDIIEQTGVNSYDELMDSEKDEFSPGWRGFEDADEPALSIDVEEMREKIIERLGIPVELESYLSNDELLQLSTAFGDIGLMREFEEMSPGDIEEASRNAEGEIMIHFQSEWSGWIEFYNSRYYDVWCEHPDLFELYKAPDGHIEMYKVRNT